MLYVYGRYKYLYSYSAGIDYRRQILTTKVYPRTVKVKQFYWPVKSLLLGAKRVF